MSRPCFNIASVEREIGLSKDVLRVWERRYGFPAPERDANGERLYPLKQVERLRLIKRLMDQGHRPGRLIAAPASELGAMLSPPLHRLSGEAASGAEELDHLLALVKQHDAAGFSRVMQQRLARQGLQRFVQDTVAPLTQKVGMAWEQARFEIFEEHLFTELINRVLRQAISAVPGGREPRILLTSLPDEPHALGLLMVEAMLAPEGAHCIALGTQMPLLEIAQAAQAHRADIVALSFSAAFPKRQIPALLQQLRGVLGRTVALWAGGAGMRRSAPPKGVRPVASLSDVVVALSEWRGMRLEVLSTTLPAGANGSKR
jgi:methylmalonyl-CoA mutase cobalamin-binding subunit